MLFFISMLTRKTETVILFAVVVLFLILRLPGLNLPYHQDEYKWPIIVNPALTEPGGIPHPPVGEFIYREFGKIVGYDNFRYVPFTFSILNFFLLFYLVKLLFDSRVALWSVFLFSISFYALLASLMVDTDGAVMPAFFLISAIGYYGLRKMNFQFSPPAGRAGIFNFAIFLIGIIGGFLVKTSFIVAIGAFLLDFLIEKQVFSDKKRFLKYFFYCIGLGLALVLILFISKLIFQSFNLQSSISYWEHFAKFSGRGWLQTFIQFSKSIMYLSPLLIIPAFFSDREIFNRTRPFFLFIFLGLFFYLFAFDFSVGALDRYFQFLIIPLCIISSAILAKLQITKEIKQNKSQIIFPVLLSFLIFLFQFLIHVVPPLYPKTEWIARLFQFKWNFLFPFTGGSGPTGFYVSFLFIAIIWLFCLVFWKKKFLLGILILGVLYNGVFIEEHLFGKINGSPYPLFAEAKEFIAKNEKIKKVVVYNDIGGYEIRNLGKYQRRFYAAPQFESTYREFFKNFSGHVLYIDIPRIGENNYYSDYLATCENIYEKKDKYITAKILNCTK